MVKIQKSQEHKTVDKMAVITFIMEASVTDSKK